MSIGSEWHYLLSVHLQERCHIMCYLGPRQNQCSYLDRTPAVCSTEIANHKSSHDQNADNGISDIWCVSLIPPLWDSLTLFINSFCGFAPTWLRRGGWICGCRRTLGWLICYSYKTCPDSMFITILPSREEVRLWPVNFNSGGTSRNKEAIFTTPFSGHKFLMTNSVSQSGCYVILFSIYVYLTRRMLTDRDAPVGLFQSW